MADELLVFFDGDCALCNRSVQFILRHEKAPVLKFSPLQSEYARKRLPAEYAVGSDFNSILFFEKGKVLSEASAVFALAAYLRFPWNLARHCRHIPGVVSNALYRLVARRRRKWFGNSSYCLVLLPEWNHRIREH